MVKKLFKHEFAAFLRSMFPVWIALLGVSLLGRLIQLFENDTTVYNVIFTSSIVAYVLAIIVSFVLCTIFAIVRFHKNLFSYEGYLTFTLPVTNNQHITVKLLTAVLFEFINVIMVLISVFIITLGDVFKEIVKAGIYLVGMAIDKMGFHTGFYAFEVILLIISAAIMEFLLFYACISLGQMSNKNRTMVAVGIYFGYYFATQIISTVIMSVIVASYEYLHLEKIFEYISAHPFSSAHIIIWCMILGVLIISSVYFLITRYVLNKKLNLE